MTTPNSSETSTQKKVYVFGFTGWSSLSPPIYLIVSSGNIEEILKEIEQEDERYWYTKVDEINNGVQIYWSRYDEKVPKKLKEMGYNVIEDGYSF